MNKNWQSIESLFHHTISLEAGERAAYLAEACLGNEPLRRDVEALVAAFEKRGDFMEQPVFSLGMRLMSDNIPDAQLVNKQVGPYRIQKMLGEGGMGKVYLAEDTQLGRNVALKFLLGGSGQDKWAKRQLVREAQAVAMVDHANICTIYKFEEVDSYSFIVMQYIEGETLDRVLQSKSLDLGRKLELAAQIATALSEAHAHGIIHRDIKPQNIMVTARDHVKVLDFGLAKLTEQTQRLLNSEDYLSQSSQLGLIPGTVAYMSPEQLRGERLGYSTDIFSFGTVLYEMIGGENPFARDNKAETITTILTSNPPSLRQNAPQIPREVDRIVQKCLKKKLSERYQSSSDLLYDIETLQKELQALSPLRRYLNVRTATAFILLLLLVLVALALKSIYSNLSRAHTVAVLPVVNLTGDSNLEYWGDGLTESMIDRLSGLSKLRVKPLTAVDGYRVREVDVQKVGHDLNVDAVLIGRLTGDKDSLILQTTLVRASDGARLWGGQYKIELDNVFAVTGEVSRMITSNMELRSAEDENRIRSEHGPDNPAAHREYMQGKYYWRNRGQEGALKAAIEHFNTAIKLDHLYARAYAGLADCYVFGNVVTYGHMTTKEAMTKAEFNSKEALDIDNSLPEAYTALGFVDLRYHWNWQEAEADFKRAIELDPDDAMAHYGYSQLLAITGLYSEAIAESETAKYFDPSSPSTALNLCRAYYYARQYDKAMDCYDGLVQEYPDYPNGVYGRGLMYLQRGKYSEAIRLLEDVYKNDKARAGAALGYAYGITGRREEAKRVLAEMLELPKSTNLPPQELALIYLGLGDVDNAYTGLQKSAEERYAPFSFLAIDPMFDKLRSDPRFINLMQRNNIPLPQPPS